MAYLNFDDIFEFLGQITMKYMYHFYEFLKLMQSIVIEIQWQSADLYRVQLCNRQFFVGMS